MDSGRSEVVGVRSDCGKARRVLSNVIRPLDLADILCPPHPQDNLARLPTAPQAKANILTITQAMQQHNPQLFLGDYVINENASDDWAKRAHARSVCPALTKGLKQGFWLGSRGRHLTPNECARAHGYRAPINWPSPPHRAYHLLGNTTSLCILERAIYSLLIAVYPRIVLKKTLGHRGRHANTTR